MQETQKTQTRLSFLTNKSVTRKIIFEVLNPKDKTKIGKKTQGWGVKYIYIYIHTHTRKKVWTAEDLSSESRQNKRQQNDDFKELGVKIFKKLSNKISVYNEICLKIRRNKERFLKRRKKMHSQEISTTRYVKGNFVGVVQSLLLRPYGLHHASLPCPSLSPTVYSNSCLLSQWYHPTISSSVTPFSSCLQSFTASGSFPLNQLFTSGGQSIGPSALAHIKQNSTISSKSLDQHTQRHTDTHIHTEKSTGNGIN